MPRGLDIHYDVTMTTYDWKHSNMVFKHLFGMGPSPISRLRIHLEGLPMSSLKHSVLALALMPWSTASAFAQAADPTATNATLTKEPEIIVVVGTRSSLNDALTVKRKADGFVDAIVASEIAQFPDMNLAEALQRVPGVTITRNQGEGGQIILRGFTPDFTRVEINGMSATPTSLGREFNFSIFASELFTKAEVRKTGSADQTEGGLAGTVSLFTPKPLTQKQGLTFAASSQASYAEQSEQVDPRVAMVLGYNWDDKFGIVGTLAYSDQSFLTQWADTSNWDRASDSIVDAQEVGVSPAILNAWIPRAPRIMRFDRERARTGASLDLQYRPNDTVLVTWSNLYGQTDRAGQELRTDLAELEGGLLRPRNVVLDNEIDGRGRIVSGIFPLATARAYTTKTSDDEQFTQSVLRGEFQVAPKWSVNLQAGLTQGRGTFFDRAYSFGREADGAVTVQGDFVKVDVVGVTPNSPVGYTLFRFADFRIREKQDDELALQFDISREARFGPFTRLSLGARYADHVASVTETKWGGINDSDPIYPATARGANGRALGLGGTPAAAVTLLPFSVSGQPAGFPTQIMQFNFDVLDNFYGLTNQKTAPRPLDSYEVSEAISAAYLKADVDTQIASKPVTGSIGVRFVNTGLISSGARQIGSVITPIRVERSYENILPSLNLRVDFSDELLLRFAAGRTLNRPTLADLSPRSTLDIGRNVGSSGNPELDPFSATYLDFGLEYYFAREALISISYFRKDIDSLVETLAEDVTLVVPSTLGGPAVPTQFQLTRPINGDEAKVEGLEFSVQAPFTFLPAPFDQFGGLFNYTYAQSEANFTDAGNVSSIQLPGLSKNSFNAVLYYQAKSLDVRLAYAWRDEFVDIPFGPGGNPIWQDAFGQLDMSATYNLTDRVALKFEGLNLTQQSEYLYTAGRKDLPVRRADNERRVGIGIRYTY